MKNRSEHPVRVPWVLLLIFVFVTVGLSAIAALIYRHQTATVIRDQYNQLEAVNGLKTRQIREWREQHIQTMELLRMSPFLKSQLKQAGSGDTGSEEAIRAWLKSICLTENFRNLVIVDQEQKIRFGAFEDTHLESTEMDAILHDLSPEKGAWFSPIHRNDQYGVHIAIIAPVLQDQLETPLYLVAIENVSRDLFPLFLKWSVPSETAESLLVRTEGDNIVFLNDLRHQPESALTLRVPRNRIQLPAVMAVSGTVGPVEGTDYRGHYVLAYVAPVPDTPWFLITKIDLDEVVRPVESWYWYVAVLTGTLVILSAALILLYWRHQRTRHHHELVQSRQAFEEQQRLWTTLLENLPGIAYRCLNDRDWTMMMVSPGCRDLTGYAPEDLIGNKAASYAELIHPSDRQRVWEAVQTAIADGKPFQMEYRIKDRQGQARWVWEQGVAVYDREGKAEAIEGFIFEISARKEADQVRNLILRISEEAGRATNTTDLYRRIQDVLQGVMDASEFYVNEYDPETRTFNGVYATGREDFTNLQYAAAGTLTEHVRQTGKAVLIGREALEQMVKNGEARIIGQPILQCMAIPLRFDDKPFAVMLLQSYDDPNRFTEEHLSLLETASNQIAAVIARKKAEQALRESESRYRELADQLPLGLYRTTPDSRFIFANPTLAEILGAENVDDLLHRQVLDFYPDKEARDRHLKLLDANPEGVLDEFQLLRLDGKRIWVRNHNRTITDENGSIVCYEGIIEDMTHQKELEEKLVQTQRLESVGQLAGGIAHDFNNLLTPVLGYVELLLDTPDLPDEMKTRLHMIQRAADSARKLVQQMLAYSRKQVLRMETVDLNGLIREMESMIRRTIPASIAINISCAKDPIWVDADRTQLEQIIINFVINARDALDNDGRIGISTDVRSFSKEDVPDPALAPGTYAVLTVEDNGRGMETATVNRIFEPFFTTKERGRGTGLGLAVVYGIVKQHKGTIRVYSEPGMGAIFRTYIPSTATPVRDEELPALKPMPGNGERILLVEDNNDVRNLARSLLEDFGYRVTDIANPLEAIKHVETESEPFDLLLTDVVMPDMNGPALYQELKKRIAALPAVFMSGYSEEIMANRGPADHSVRFVEKPFTSATLTRAIADALRQT